MKQFISIAIFAGLLALNISLAAQDQRPPDAQPSPAGQSGPSAQPQAEPSSATPQSAPPPEVQPQAPQPTNPSLPATKRAKRKKSGAKALVPGHKVVVRNGGARDESAELAPGMSHEQELHSRENTAQLVATTNANLNSIAGRQLTPAQQSLLNQIRTYMRQSKSASDSGDLARAHTLAYKAHLLSDELKK